MATQSVLFPVDKFTVESARAWLRQKGYVHDGKVHTTAKYHRFRQYDPIPGDVYRTHKREEGIKMIVFSRNSKDDEPMQATRHVATRADLDNMGEHIHHLGIIAGSDTKLGKVIAGSSNPKITKALATLASLALARDGVDDGQGDVYRLTDNERERLHKLVAAKTHAERSKVLRGKGFFDVLKTGAGYTWKILRGVAPLVVKYGPLLELLYDTYIS